MLAGMRNLWLALMIPTAPSALTVVGTTAAGAAASRFPHRQPPVNPALTSAHQPAGEWTNAEPIVTTARSHRAEQ
jgi:hypothetical protein